MSLGIRRDSKSRREARTSQKQNKKQIKAQMQMLPLDECTFSLNFFKIKCNKFSIFLMHFSCIFSPFGNANIKGKNTYAMHENAILMSSPYRSQSTYKN